MTHSTQIAELTKQVSLADAPAWAELSGDHNPLHTDPEFVKQTRYGQPILHGHLTLAWITEWAQAWARPNWTWRGRLTELRCFKPLYPGVQYTVRRQADLLEKSVHVLVILPAGDVGVKARLTLETEEGNTA